MDVESLTSLGGECLLRGELNKAVWALDAALFLSPGVCNPGLWQRGLACFYRGHYGAAAEQFESNMAENGSDIEEVLWNFVSRAKNVGYDAAKQDGFLQLSPAKSSLSTLPPMSQVLKLYQGQCSIQDVLSAAVDSEGSPLPSYNGTSALAYAHFYIGLYHELREELQEAEVHLKAAADMENPDFIGKLMVIHYQLFLKAHPKLPAFTLGAKVTKSYKCSRVIQGGWQLSSGHVVRGESETVTDRVAGLMRAYSAGVRAFDCGDIYSGVEWVYGRLISALRLRGVRERDIHIHTKFVPDLDVIRAGRVNENYVRCCVRRSLNRLGVECLSLVQLHWWDLSVPGCIATVRHLYECVKEGLVEQVGLTNFDTETTRDIVLSGIPIATTQVQFSLLDHRPLTSGLVSLCMEHDIKILAYGVLAGGFLTDRWLGVPRPEAEDLANRSLVKYLLIIDEFGGWGLFQELLQTLQSIANRHSSNDSTVTIAMVAIQYVLQQEAVGGVIIGAHNNRYLESTIAATRLCLQPGDLTAIDGVLTRAAGPTGSVYGLERDFSGKHGRIMKYSLSGLNTGDHLDELCHRYLQLVFSARPTEATRTGYRFPPHTLTDAHSLLATKSTSYDHHTDVTCTEDIDTHLKRVRHLLEEAEGIDKASLSKEQLVDLQLIVSQLNLRFVMHQKVESHKKDPLTYLPLNAILYLLPVWGDEGQDSEYRLEDHTHPGVADMSVDQRLSALLSRLRAIPSILICAHRGLTAPVKAFVETAIKICKFFSSFLATEVAPLCVTMLGEGASEDCIAEVELAAQIAGKCVETFGSFLSNELLPGSSSVTGVGREVYSDILCYSHFIESSEELLKLGETHFETVKEGLEKLAREIDPTKTWQEITKIIINPMHPTADDLLSTYMAEFHRARDHMISHDLVAALPQGECVRGFTTPSFLTPFSPVGDYLNPSPFAGMSSSTPPQRAGHLMLHSITARPPHTHQALLRGHDYCWISVVSPHESYPGHHVQALLAQTHPRVLRKYHESILFYEGWGLYTEELAYETGFFRRELEYTEEDSKERKKLSAERFEQLTRLTQLRLRLWRAARVILDAKLNLGEMSVEECRDFLHREVMLNEGATEGEVFMYVSQPCYAPCYVGGYVMLMKLREEMRGRCVERGEEFSLRDFHDLVLSKGCIPFKLLQTLL